MSEDKNKSTTGKTMASLESSEILETHPGDEVLAIALTVCSVLGMPTPIFGDLTLASFSYFV